MEKRVPAITKKINKLPDAPGIYLFYTKSGELIYVGKATSLRSRVRSYFAGRRTSRPIEQMMHEVANIDYKPTASVLEAIILEAKWIKQKQPKYNVLGKDNKSWNYLALTKEKYPHLQAVRQHDMVQLSAQEKRKQFLQVFGPFPGLNTKATLKLLRKLFWLSLCSEDASRPCLYYQMGECLGVCTGEITATEYKKRVIQPLKTFLGGGKKRLLNTLERRMKEASKEKAYEEAARLRDQIKWLTRIHDVALLNKSFVQDELRAPGEEWIQRIEGYDISNLGASGKVGSMVVFDATGPVKSQYRKFKIKTVEGQSDVACLEEVLRRRFKHTEWAYPDILLIDGGRPQVNRTKKVLQELEISIPVIGLAKGPTRKKLEFILGSKETKVIRWLAGHQDLLVRVRDEAHRFAIQYQKTLRKIKKR